MAKNPGGRQENTKGSKGSFSAGASPASGKQSVATGGGGGGGIASFFSNLFGGGGDGGAPQNRMPDGSRMDTITKPYVGGKTYPNYGQVNLGMAAPGTPGLADKLALSAAAQAAASQPQGIMGVLQNFMPGAIAGRALSGLAKTMRPASAFPPRFGPDGQMTPYGQMVADRSRQIALDMSSRGNDDSSYVPSVDETAPTAADPNQVPGERPPWWPSYLPWPPAPNVSVPQAAPAASPMGTQPTGSLPAPTPYGTSYSNLQSAISGAQNPLMMGIGGMLRRP